MSLWIDLAILLLVAALVNPYAALALGILYAVSFLTATAVDWDVVFHNMDRAVHKLNEKLDTITTLLEREKRT